jgi:CBS domain-containing membrane protein
VKKKIRRSFRKARYVVYRQTIIEPLDHLWTFVGAFIGIGLIGFIQSNFLIEQDNIFLIGSFGASAVLVFGAVNSPLAQPRNLIFGHFFSAIVGVTVAKFVPGEVWLPAALAVSLAIVVMQITKTMHPPGGATALIAVIGSAKIKSFGYFYVLSPVLSGVLILLIIALIVNNIPKSRSYPSRK